MLRFDQCLNIRNAGMNIRQITNAARYRKLAPEELLEVEVQLRRIEMWLNTHPTQWEMLCYMWYRLKKTLWR